jgi:hypothetical protein
VQCFVPVVELVAVELVADVVRVHHPLPLEPVQVQQQCDDGDALGVSHREGGVPLA